MRKQFVLGMFLSVAVCFAAVQPAAAQEFGVGLSVLDNDGGVGVIVDYAKPFREQSNGNLISWVGDFSYHRNSEDLGTSDLNGSNVFAQAGIRLGGALGDNLAWHGQGLLGIHHAALSIDDDGGVCDLFDTCDASDTNFIGTVGGAIQYNMSQSGAVRAQLDFPLGDTRSAIRFSAMYIFRLGN